MTTKPEASDGSPSASTLFLPQFHHPRRASVTSLPSIAIADRETLSQALDQINQHASQTESLTTFNEYTSPPLSSSGGEGKGIASELQGGLSGLYNKFRASVGNVRDRVTLAGDGGGGEEASAKVPNLTSSSSTSVAWSKGHGFKSSTSSVNPGSSDTVDTPGQQSSLVREDEQTQTSHPGQAARPPRLPLGSASNTSFKGSLTPNGPFQSHLPPVAMATTLVSPATAEVNVRAGTEVKSSNSSVSQGVVYSHPISQAEEHLSGTAKKQKIGGLTPELPLSPVLVKDSPEPSPIHSSFSKSDHKSEKLPLSAGRTPLRDEKAARTSTEETGSTALPGSGTVSEIDYFTPPKNVLEVPKIITHPGSPQIGSGDESNGASHKARTSKYEHAEPYQHLELPAHISQKISHHYSHTKSGIRTPQPTNTAFSAVSSMDSPTQRLSDSDESEYLDQRGKSQNSHARIPIQPLPNNMVSRQDFNKTKGRVLNKEYWMKDENARDCFYCGDSFSTFRRKHHCRTCGQIFDAKCTSLLPGDQFGYPFSIRVCKPCEGIINGYDDSSEFSDDSNFPTPSLRPRHGSTGASDTLGSPGPRSSPGSLHHSRHSPKHADISAPTMSIPATRKAKGDFSRKPTVLEIEAERTLTRPSSSRSLKSSFPNRPYTPGHRRHNSRHLNQRVYKPFLEDSAPFHRNVDDTNKQNRLPAFHDDNIIDPDLAPYLSDDASSGDEQISIAAAIHGEGIARSFETDKNSFSNFLATSRKGRSKTGDKSTGGLILANRDTDTYSLSSTRTLNAARSSRRRNLSAVGNLHLRPSPRAHRNSAAIPISNTRLHENFSSSALAQMMSTSAPTTGPRMIRSSSMRGAAAPAVELNSASLDHVRKLLRQLLTDSCVPCVNGWEKALVPILLQATDDVNPNVQNGDDMDLRHYVKFKKILGGKPGDTSYVSGLVFTKNLALKSMPRSISHPNILILTFPLEYSRHQQHFMSLEPVIRQEREFLQNLVNRIAALHPQLLLVEKNVSGLALGFLEAANIATAYNVKPSVLEAVSRCSQTRIVSSIDKLAIKPPQAGKCASFYLKTYVHGNRRRTYMFLSGCAKELGCTIVLRGADHNSLVRIKRITEFMIYVVYNLKLETCLMRDEFALIPSVTRTGTLSPGLGINMKASPRSDEEPMHSTNTINEATRKLQSLQPSANRASPDVCNADVLASGKSTFPETAESNNSAPEDGAVPDDIPMPTFYGDMVEEHRTKILSASPFVKFMQPYLLMRAREQERRLAYLRRLRDLDDLESDATKDKSEPRKFELIRPDMVHETIQSASRSVRQVLRAVHDAEYDKALYHYKTQSKQWEAYISANINLFDPRAHQNIAVLYSVVCTVTTIPCAGPDLLALGFYNEHEIAEDFESDCTLGQYVEDLCLGANTVCTANGCEKKMFDHHRQYVHGEAQISVFVEQYPCKLRGLQNTILMWSCCRKCGKETQVMPMSDSTWKYSFGKYLELSFWSKDVHARAGVCPHDLHRDHLRFFGFKDLALRIHYDPITLLEVIVPRARITWKVENDLRFKNDLYVKIEDRINKYMTSVKARIKSIMIESVVPEKTEACKQEVDRLRERARDEHRVLIYALQESYMTSQHYETVPFNRAIRVTQEKVTEWDNAFADFDRNFFPSEKDIRRLATLQLKKIFLDRDDSNSSITSSESGNVVEIPNALLTEKPTSDEQPALTPQTRQMSPEKAHHMLSSVVNNDASRNQNGANEPDTHQSAPPTAVPCVSSEEPQAPRDIEREDIRHLDLATSSELADKGAPALALLTGEPRAIDFASKDCRKDRVGNTMKSEDNAALNLEPIDGLKQPVDLQAAETQLQHTAAPRSMHVSGIPRPSVDSGLRRTVLENRPTIHRAHSQPSQQQREPSIDDDTTGVNLESKNRDEVDRSSSSPEKPSAYEKRLSDRLHLSNFKPIGVSTHSMIPRSIVRGKKDSHVSTLAKHFEQLSREFEKERIKERRQRFSRSRQSRVYPMAAAKPIVEVYRNVREAVEEKDPSDEELPLSEPPLGQSESPSTIDNIATNIDSQTPGQGFHAEDTTAENTEAEDNVNPDSHAVSEAEGEGAGSEEDRSLLEEVPGTEEEHHALSPTEAQLDLKLDLPKHEKTSLVKMLTNFWAERSASGWQALDYPLNTFDHIFADSDIIVREDEPSSLIALALDSEDYRTKLKSITSNLEESPKGLKPPMEDPSLTFEEQCAIQRSLHRSTGTHLKYQYQEGSAKMLCKVFYTEQFDAIRRKCGVSTRIVESLSRCLKWDSKGGKTKSLFLKTLDDRFVLKSLSTIETQSFLRFAPAYFQLISECLFQELPSVIAKMLGFYQIIIKNPVTGVDFNWFLIVMENLFYDRSPTRIFDLKGSMRNRRIQSTGEQNEVLLDENMVEFIYESPLFAREHSKKVLRGSVWNDTLFLARQNVMDYSLMIAIDESRKELVVGIIDCIRTYTWDKKLESWIKDRGKNRPTVTSPRDYKNRFREAMSRYVLQAPNCWHQFHAQQVETRALRLDDREETGESELQAATA